MALMYTNIFDAIMEDAAEASELQTRSDLMIAIRDIVDAKGWDQKQAAAAMGITQPRVSDLVNGRIEKFSIDKLMTYLYKIGFRFKPQFENGQLTMSVQSIAEKQNHGFNGIKLNRGNTMGNMGTAVWFGSREGNTGLSLFTSQECTEKRFNVTDKASYLDQLHKDQKHTFADKTIASIYLPEVDMSSIEIMLLKELAISQNIQFRVRGVSSDEELKHYKNHPFWE